MRRLYIRDALTDTIFSRIAVVRSVLLLHSGHGLCPQNFSPASRRFHEAPSHGK
jgi:hypothetical protein